MAESRTPAEIAEGIAEAVRLLNYATMPVTGELEYPGDLCSVLADLKIAAERMPQAFDQMARWITAEHDAGRVAHDQGADVGEYVSAVADALERASNDAVALGAALYNAHEASSTLKAVE